MELRLPIDGIKRQLRDIYESRFFPVWCLLGGTIMVGLTNDIIWVIIGAGAFVIFLFKRR